MLIGQPCPAAATQFKTTISDRMDLMLKTLLLVIPLALAGVANAAPPNILLIMIDDLGWMDLHCQGNEAVETPRIDQLAREGLRFTDAYAAAPVCSPTRAALMTGQAPARLRITNHTPDRPSFTPEDAKLLPAPMHNELTSDAVTLAEQLKGAGYATAFMGKWHLSGPGRGDPALEPTKQGFDINLGGCGFGGPPTFFDPYKIPNLPSRQPGEYLPDRLADEAIAFMKQPRDAPFLLCLWNYTVHWPMEAPEPLLKKYANHKGRGLNDSRYGAMIEAMDQSIGRVLTAVDDLKLRDETLVIFTSDNGGFSGVADNRPLRAGKGHLYEGGIRVPLIVRWPGHTPEGGTTGAPVVTMDLHATILAAAGVKPEDGHVSDGVDLRALLEGKPMAERSLYFHYPNYAFHRANRLGSAVRRGDWKLIERFDNGDLELFNLKKDLSEKTNLAEDHPELARRLAKELHAWRKQVDAAMPRPR